MKLNLRQKIFLHFLVFIIFNSVIWIFNYYSNSIINRKLVIIEKKKELLDTVLEARRYEKNFFLRNNKEDLHQALSYIELTAQKQAGIIENYIEFLENPAAVRQRTQNIQIYRQNLRKLFRVYDGENAGVINSLEMVNQIRETVTRLGRELTTDIEQFEKAEQEQVFNLLARSKHYLVISMGSLFLLAVLTAFFLVMNVNRPLKAIALSIQKIAKGDFDSVPQIKTGDEFESLANSLNRMITELDKRRDQLVQAEKMSSLGTLTSGVAHELNNPLNNISTSVQIIQEELEDGDVEFKKNLLAEVEQQIDRARDIIRALLEFSRQSEFSKKQIRFSRLVRHTMHLLSGEIPANVEMDIQVEESLEGGMDPRRIQQVLLNLIINAVHAMPEGGRIVITAENNPEKKQFVFSVSDTGEGIPKENLAKIFDPFFTTKEVGKGSGLGLSIIHGIIVQHGGTIDVESVENEGTVFTVRLPE